MVFQLQFLTIPPILEPVALIVGGTFNYEKMKKIILLFSLAMGIYCHPIFSIPSNLSNNYPNPSLETNQIELPNCSDFKVEALIRPISCFGRADGQINLNISGGTAPYLIQWEDIGLAQKVRKYLRAGTYTAHLTDHNGCKQSVSVILTTPQKLSLREKLVQNCGNTAMSLYPDGGTWPYTFEWEHSMESNEHLVFTESGEYKLRLSDAHNCAIERHFDIEVIPPLEVALQVQHADCEQAGNIQVEISGGLPPYYSDWLETAKSTSNRLSHYQLKVVDSGNCTTEVPFDMEENCPEFLSFDVALTENQNQLEVLTYPNPFYKQFSLDFLEPLQENTTIMIKNSFGQILEKINIKKGTTTTNLDLSKYSAGMYWLSWNKNKEARNVKMMKIN